MHVSGTLLECFGQGGTGLVVRSPLLCPRSIRPSVDVPACCSAVQRQGDERQTYPWRADARLPPDQAMPTTWAAPNPSGWEGKPHLAVLAKQMALAVRYGVADTMATRNTFPDFSSGRRVDPLDDELVSAALGAPVGAARS